MLRQRIVTALVLVALLLGALALRAAWPFALLLLALIAAAAWEWARLVGATPAVALASGGAMAVAGLAALAAGWHLRAPALLWTAGSAAWLLLGAAALQGGVARWQRWPAGLRGVFGFAVLFVAWLAVAHARTLGVNFLLSLLCVVWMADIAAYFGGRAFGRRKLAPSISPGKSWAGVWSGMAGVLLLAAIWLTLDARWGFDGPSVFTRLRQALGTAGMVVVLLVLCAASVVGDLVESLAKRAAGAKDSSQLLPGHGGVLDRVDALLPVLPAALAVLAWSTAR